MRGGTCASSLAMEPSSHALEIRSSIPMVYQPQTSPRLRKLAHHAGLSRCCARSQPQPVHRSARTVLRGRGICPKHPHVLCHKSALDCHFWGSMHRLALPTAGPREHAGAHHDDCTFSRLRNFRRNLDSLRLSVMTVLLGCIIVVSPPQ